MRVALFFDGNNFYRSMDCAQEGVELNYDLLVKWVVDKAGGANPHYVGAYYYTGFSEQSNLDKFLRGLELRTGFFVRREPIVERMVNCPYCGQNALQKVEKRVDTRLVAEMVMMAAVDNYDRAVVFSGDEDLVPALDAVAALGKQVFVASWSGHAVASALRRHSFGMIDLSEGIEEFTTGRRRTVAEEEGDERFNDTAATIEDLFSQIQQAWMYFNGRKGHVSRWFFENKWKPNGRCPPPGALRQQFVEALISQGKIDCFEAEVNGRVVTVIRPKKI